MNAEATAYRVLEDDEELHSQEQHVTHHMRTGPRYNDWTPTRGHHGVHRWIYKATGTQLGICVMGDVYGPYGHDHHKVLDWAWQTWPWTRRSDHMSGSASHVVTLVRRHAQCEIDLHRSSCMLLSARGVLPPLVFRPWCEVSLQPWVVTFACWACERIQCPY